MKDFIHTLLLTSVFAGIAILVYRDFERQADADASAARAAQERSELRDEVRAALARLEVAAENAAKPQDPGMALINALLGMQDNLLGSAFGGGNSGSGTTGSAGSASSSASKGANSTNNASSPEEALAGAFSTMMNPLGSGCGPSPERATEIAALAVPDPSIEQAVRAYLERLAELTEGQTCRTTTDIQVEKITLIGADNIPILLEYMDGILEYHALQALKDLARPEDAPYIAEELRKHDDLIGVVNELGIQSEVCDIVAEKLPYVDGFRANEWLDAAIECADPATYQTMIVRMLDSHLGFAFEERYYKVLTLKDFPVDELHKQIWRKQRDERLYDDEEVRYAREAAAAGEVDALTKLAKTVLDEKWRGSKRIFQQIRQAVDQLVSDGDSPEEKALLIDLHHKDAEYDAETRRYHFPAGKPNVLVEFSTTGVERS